MMTIFQRTKNIIISRIQKSEISLQGPEVEFEKALQISEDSIRGLQKSAAIIYAEKLRLEKQIEKMEGEQAEWLEKATRAVGAGQDDLARKALLQKKAVAREIDKCYDFINKAEQSFNHVKIELQEMREKCESLKEKIKQLKYRNLMNDLGMGNHNIGEEEDRILELKFSDLRNITHKY